MFFGLGIGLYFSLRFEPHWALGIGFLTLSGYLAYWSIRRFDNTIGRILGISATLVAICAGGITAAQWRTLSAETVMLSKPIGPTQITGRVVKTEAFPRSLRITLENPVISGLLLHRTPERVRIRARGAQPRIGPGDWVRLRASLSPPPPPAAPKAFDFQRHAYFQGIGAIGFGLGRIDVTGTQNNEFSPNPTVSLAKLRATITNRILLALKGDEAGVAAALMTGERSAVAEKILDAIRDSGLAHLLSISGLHIGLIAGILFTAIRAGLALAGPVALKYPIKKWAAAGAIIGAFAYALIAGATLPTQRAFLMIALALMGVILDRRGLSLRSVAWAALVILAVQPESLLGASFQMSFSAVVALIAGYEWMAARRMAVSRPPGYSPNWAKNAGTYLMGIALTTLIAGAATGPFAVFHFNRFADYGLIANVMAVPVTALWVMPWAVVSFLLMPFGAEATGLIPMSWGIGLVIDVAELVAGWPGAVTLLPAMPTWGIAAIALGGLWLCLWRQTWRLWGFGGIAAGFVALAMATPPDILVDGAGRVLAIRDAGGELVVSGRRRARFQREIWNRLSGNDDQPRILPATGRRMGGRLACDAEACLYRHGQVTAALLRHESALGEDCWAAELVIAMVPLRRRCPAARVIDRFTLWREGSHAIWMEGGRYRIETVNGMRGYRPWVLRPDTTGASKTSRGTKPSNRE